MKAIRPDVKVIGVEADDAAGLQIQMQIQIQVYTNITSNNS